MADVESIVLHESTRGAYAALKVSADLVRGVLAELAPVASNRHGVTDRKGFLQTEIDTILAVMDPGSPTNPWKGEHTKERNFLIAQWLAWLLRPRAAPSRRRTACRDRLL